MRLEDYWGVGPKTAALLERELGVGAAVAAIEASDVRTLVDAGLPSGRATRILRRANGGRGMAVLATGDARDVYRAVLELARERAVSRGAADRIRVLTPLQEPEAIERRLDRVEAARETWRRLDEPTRREVLDAFAVHDDLPGDRAAVECALSLREAGVREGVFEPLADLPSDLADLAAALAHLDGDDVRPGYDDRLDRLRDAYAAADRLNANAIDVVEEVRDEGIRGSDEFREAYVEYVVRETGADAERVRATAPDDATDAADFAGRALRDLVADLREAVDEREEEVAAELREAIDADEVAVVREAVDDLALDLSLARFADAYNLSRPTILEERDALAVRGARNLSLVERGEDVQPVTYAVGDHELEGADAPPRGDRVAVLTGANSGGKTTLLETLCQAQVLAHLGVPVPAERAEVTLADAIVFHRRHASFNAGVLESTLRAIVPPLCERGRTLMLVDEFEAITEPGSAADLLHGLVELTVNRGAAGVFVTHLADDLEPLPEPARTDGIVARGLDADLELAVDYQPRFDSVGRSTPEFIVSRLVADARDREHRAGYRALASAVGEEAVQRTLLDAKWSGTEADSRTGKD